MGRIFSNRSSRTPNTPQHQLAASLVTQGLFNFAILVAVTIVALICSLALAGVYQLMSILSLAAFSSILSSGLFRETFRASSSISGTIQLERRLQEALDQAEDLKQEIREGHLRKRQHQGSDQDQEGESDPNFSPRSGARNSAGSWINSNLSSSAGEPVIFDEPPRRSSAARQSRFSEEIEEGSNYHSTSALRNLRESSQNNFLVNMELPNLGLSFHAFEDGAQKPRQREEQEGKTLGNVSVLGSDWEKSEELEMSEKGLPPPARSQRRNDGSRRVGRSASDRNLSSRTT